MIWEQIVSWCEQNGFGTPIEEIFPGQHHLSQVFGVGLKDGQSIVIKARPWHFRIFGCIELQRELHKAGYPCPQILAGPKPLNEFLVTAEEYVAGGEIHTSGDDLADQYATALADLSELAPPAAEIGDRLDPPPTWVRWDHPGAGIWPLRDDGPEDLNEFSIPAWLTDLGLRLREKLCNDNSRRVVGHVDFEAQNIRFLNNKLIVVHDWDSAAIRTEPAVVGAAAAVYTANGQQLTEASVQQTSAFLDVYECARGRKFSQPERQICWAAGLWVRTYNAVKAYVDQELGRADASAVLNRLLSEVDERLEYAGV